MVRHEQIAERVEPFYEVDTLGAPFKVIVLDCVTKKVDPTTGKVLTKIPDLVGLIKAVVRSRVTHPRKLNGAEIKFIRNALGVKAIVVADFFEMSAEHLSRCESGTKVMSSLIEKSFRLMMFVASFHPNPEELLLEALQGRHIAETIKNGLKKPDEVSKMFLEQFLTMKIESVYDASEELCFEFSRDPFDPTDTDRPEEDNDVEWEPKQKLVCYGGR